MAIHICERVSALRWTLLSASVALALPVGAYAQQLEEVVVTAERRQTNLQTTPISIQAFTAQDLDLGGIERGEDLGIMSPNVVLNPSGGGGPGGGNFYMRGLPGVGVYIDGVWQGSAGLLQSDFVEVQRVEVLRGPQGTLFGRNTNAGAINIVTKPPADTFGARAKLELGSFDRRDLNFSVDLPLSSTVKTKWMAASLKNNGFLKDLTRSRSLGDQNDTLLRGDVLWEPTGNFSMRVTVDDEIKHGTPGRIVRITDPTHPRYIAYNVLAGNPDFLAQARAIDPTFPDPPKQLAMSAFTPQTVQPGYPGGEVGKWQTKSDTPLDGVERDLRYATFTLNWQVADHFAIESISSYWKQLARNVTDFDGSPLKITTDDYRTRDRNVTEELHFTGDNYKGRVNWLAGLYYLDETIRQRFYRWAMWEFAVPNTGPNPPGMDMAAVNYVRQYGTIVGNPSLANFVPLTFISSDVLTQNQTQTGDALGGTDKAFFGQVAVSATPKLDLTIGVRVTGHNNTKIMYTPTDAFRTADPNLSPVGDPFAGIATSIQKEPDLGYVTTHKFSAQYQFTNSTMGYVSYAEGFGTGSVEISQYFADPIILEPEVVKTDEIGIKTDLLSNRLRFNADYYTFQWDHLRVPILPDDPNNPGQKLPFPVNTSKGKAAGHGAELDLTWAATPRMTVGVSLALAKNRYKYIGVPDPTGVNGLQPGLPFAYSPDHSASLDLTYDESLSGGGHILWVGRYGWSDKYVTDPANQRIRRDANGNIIYEPAYGVFNASMRYEPMDRSWYLELWGRNLGDVQYINGGFDARTVWGYDFSTIGRSRELGAAVGFTF